MLAMTVSGMRIDEALQLTRKQLVDELGGLAAQKQHAAALAIETLRSAISNNK